MLHFKSHAEKRIRKMSKERAKREVENGVNSHQFLYQSLGETWHQTGENRVGGAYFIILLQISNSKQSIV